MSTRWGFDLDMAAVRLMRREGADWREIAVEKIEGADIEDRLMAMVDRIDDAAPVELFLPRDQILYTDVEVSSKDSATSEIEKAMEGRTPYPRDELDLDWEMTGPSTARVAAIALETLDEAAAFAEARQLRVGGFSSLANAADFPRNPDFSGHSIFDADPDDDEEESEVEIQFATARQPSRPPLPLTEAAKSVGERDPVVHVDDATPVMQVTAPVEAPLNPGRPISAPTSAPRVRTDIAAASVSDHVASLAPSSSVKVHREGPTILKTVAILAAVFLLTIGIATLVWKYLPLGPGSDPIQPVTEATSPTEGQSALELEESSETKIASAPQAELETQTAVAPELPELPQPVADQSVVTLAEPDLDDVPVIAMLGTQPVIGPTPELLSALRSGEGLPAYDPSVPGTPTPKTLASLLIVAPFSGPVPTDEIAENTNNIYIASVERSDLSFDAIALPNYNGLSADALPAIPEPADETDAAEPEIASIDATSAVEEALAASIDQPDASALPRPTAFAAAIPKTQPQRRPAEFVEEIERQRFGGRTRNELASLKPPPRPESAQTVATRESEPAPATELAVATSSDPRARPQNFDAIVAQAIVQREAGRLTASLDYQAPDTSSAIEAALEADAEPETRPQDSPRLSIPSSASVSRQATIENAIRLNKVNLVGVYGTPSDRRALVRLSSGRYVKVKVGDRVDGGTVAQITDSELFYRKGNRTLSLSMPKG